MAGSPFDRPQGYGFSSGSIFPISSNAGGLFADGYVIENRGTLRSVYISFSGMAVSGAPDIMVVRDGPSGQVLLKLPLYGVPTVGLVIPIPVEVENGVYVTGISGLSGYEAVEATFVFENREPGQSDQEFPR